MSEPLETEISVGQQTWIDFMHSDWLHADLRGPTSIAKIKLSNGRTVEVIFAPSATDSCKWGIHHVTEEGTLLRLAVGPDLLLQLHNAKFELERIVAGILPIRSHLRYV